MRRSLPLPSLLKQRANSLLALLLVLVACSSKPAVQYVAFHTGEKIVSFKVEVVKSRKDIELGFMYRKELAPDRGMLFIFPADTQSPFWMKNTFVPLDIVFLDKNMEVIDIIRETTPLLTKLLYPKKSYRYVVEIGAGIAASRGIEIGNKADLPL
jgi:uncharacterized protein